MRCFPNAIALLNPFFPVCRVRIVREDRVKGAKKTVCR